MVVRRDIPGRKAGAGGEQMYYIHLHAFTLTFNSHYTLVLCNICIDPVSLLNDDHFSATVCDQVASISSFGDNPVLKCYSFPSEIKFDCVTLPELI